MTEQYRINYVMEEIHELNDDGDACEFLCTFYQIGATNSNSEATIIRKIEDWEQKNWEIQDQENWDQ